MIKGKYRESELAAQDFIDELRAGAAEDTVGVQKLQSAILDVTRDMPQSLQQSSQSFDARNPKRTRFWVSPKWIISGVSLASVFALMTLIMPLAPESNTPKTVYSTESELVFAELVLAEDEFLFSDDLQF